MSEAIERDGDGDGDGDGDVYVLRCEQPSVGVEDV